MLCVTRRSLGLFGVGDGERSDWLAVGGLRVPLGATATVVYLRHNGSQCCLGSSAPAVCVSEGRRANSHAHFSM
jgi:hypothetical protein